MNYFIADTVQSSYKLQTNIIELPNFPLNTLEYLGATNITSDWIKSFSGWKKNLSSSSFQWPGALEYHDVSHLSSADISGIFEMGTIKLLVIISGKFILKIA